jgi:hypothetical protein
VGARFHDNREHGRSDLPLPARPLIFESADRTAR